MFKKEISFLLFILIFGNRLLFSQTADLKFDDLDTAYKNEVAIENKALTERIANLPKQVIEINKKIAQSLRLKNYQEALQFANTMDSIVPKNADIKDFKGKMYALLNNTFMALQFFDAAISLNKKNKWFYIHKATLLSEENSNEKALQTLTKLAKVYPNWSIGYNVQASILRNLGKNTESLAAYNKAILSEPKSAQIYTNRGDLYLLLNDKNKAILDYKNALQLEPDYKRASEKVLSIK